MCIGCGIDDCNNGCGCEEEKKVCPDCKQEHCICDEAYDRYVDDKLRRE